MTSPHDELQSLFLDWEAGTLDAAGTQRLRALLKSDEEARAEFLRQQMLTAALKLDDEAGLTPTEGGAITESLMEAADPAGSVQPAALPTDHSSRGVIRVRSWIAVAAGLTIWLLAGRVVHLELTDEQDPVEAIAERDAADGDAALVRDASQEATAQGVAVITRLVDVVWDADQPALEVGDAIAPGRFAIGSGFAQIEFFCGATVVLEGPAELDLKSSTLARVHGGRLRAQVPPAARGFSLEVDDLTVVDLGTEFGLSVSPEGADVQVFDGEVELHPAHEARQRLTAGQALAVAADGGFLESEVTPEQFLDIAALEQRDEVQHAVRYDEWKNWSDALQRDPRVIVYYAFDGSGGWDRRLPSHVEPANSDLDGAIVGARQVPGRWDAKQALEFKRPGDRVRVQIPGEYGSLTFACWVKIDSLDRWFNSLFLTDHYNQGEPHWQILDSGQMYFSVRPNEPGTAGPRDYKVLSPPFWHPSMSGRWQHLVTTYDVEAGRVTHYLNGKPLHSEAIPAEQLVQTTRIGAASIGNWSVPTQPDAEFAIRNLNGSIDEFVIFAAALPADEIREMYEHGKP